MCCTFLTYTLEPLYGPKMPDPSLPDAEQQQTLFMGCDINVNNKNKLSPLYFYVESCVYVCLVVLRRGLSRPVLRVIKGKPAGRVFIIIQSSRVFNPFLKYILYPSVIFRFVLFRLSCVFLFARSFSARTSRLGEIRDPFAR